jgi:outer membrane lipoprotein-sorting protein
MRPADNINELIKGLHLRASADLDRKVHDDISSALAKSETTKPAHAELNMWRTIMKSKTVKLTAAVVIIVAVLGGITFWPTGGRENKKWWLGPPAAWAQEILATLDTIKTVTCREQTVLVMADGSQHTSSGWDVFYISRDSYRRDIYDGDFLREIQWYIPDGNDMIQHYVRFDLQCHGALRHKGTFGTQDPVERMRFYVRLLDKADKLLGERFIDNHNCVGFEISASKYGDNPEQWVDRIWFDVETKLPVCIEKHGRPVTDQPNKTFTTIQDQFDYNPQLPADTFTPWVPEGFINAHPDEIQQGRQKEQKG